MSLVGMKALRIFSSVGADEERVNTLTVAHPLAAALLNETIRRLSHCIVTRLDRCALIDLMRI